MAVPSAPTMPPTPWTPKTSRLSSYLNFGFSQTTAQRQTTPAMAPRTMAPTVPAKPAAGVMATRPATAPEAAPRSEAWPRMNFSAEAQANAADPLLQSVPEDRRATLLARRDTQGGRVVYHFDLYMQGERETVFFDV